MDYYAGIPQEVYDGFLKADSKGKYLAAHIKGKFGHSKV